MLRRILAVFFVIILLPAALVAMVRAFRQWRKYNEHVRTGARHLDQVYGPGFGRIYRRECSVSYFTFLRATWAKE